jgi:hypothetical protein
MSGHRFLSLRGAVEYELRCDGCGDLFRCGDDSYYSWPVLCDAAEAEGWRVEPAFDGEHECPHCAGSGRLAAALAGLEGLERAA